jgi:hypothetical protein
MPERVARVLHRIGQFYDLPKDDPIWGCRRCMLLQNPVQPLRPFA